MTSKRKILIVEDNVANLKLAGDLLEMEGFEVARCTDAENALDVLTDLRPELILMDIGLPGMDGLQLTRILKSRPSIREIKIIALSAFAMKSEKEEALAAGCDGYITKPIDTRLFARQLEVYLDKV